MTGRFITIEGGEGSGKSTQIRLLMNALATASIPAIQTREPGGTEGAEAIRDLLLRGDAGKWDDVTETLLFYASRREHIARVVWPQMEQGKTVVCDRFADSTRVYQGFGKGLGDDYVMSIHHLVLGAFQPNLTLWLDIEVDTGLERATSRPGEQEVRFESMQKSFHERVRGGFQHLAEQEPHRVVRINASQSIAEVHHDIIRTINGRLGLNLSEQADG
jgi:dTMP kinase